MLAAISARAESLDTVDYHYFVAKLENIAVITEGRLNFSIALHQKQSTSFQHWKDLSATVLQNRGSSTLMFPELGPQLINSDLVQKAGAALLALSKSQHESAINLTRSSN